MFTMCLVNHDQILLETNLSDSVKGAASVQNELSIARSIILTPLNCSILISSLTLVSLRCYVILIFFFLFFTLSSSLSLSHRLSPCPLNVPEMLACKRAAVTKRQLNYGIPRTEKKQELNTTSIAFD
jgi:hypothetical protein